jgi:ubiquinone/menaquinone biosynthesis C-methylase UbiE
MRASERGGRAPYRDLSFIYDDLVGDTAFVLWRENFERLVNRHNISFDAAADVACGTGHALEYLAESCSRVYGVDRSRQMLERARDRTGSESVILIEGTFTDFELPERVDLLTCNFDSLNYVLEENELEEALRRFALALKPEGFAVFDMNTTRELEVDNGSQVLVHRVRGGISIWESTWDPVMRINTLFMTNFVRLEDDTYRMSEEIHHERAYDTELVCTLLGAAGFSWVKAVDAKGLGDVNERTRRVEFVARK